MLSFSLVLVVAFICVVSAEYFKVQTETCTELQNSTYFFNSFLLPCGSYSSDSVEMNCLNVEQTQVSLKTVPDWTYAPNSVTGDAIKRTFVFNDFQEAFIFMAETAQLAEKNQHHPDWRNLWNTVEVTLTTDDKACLSSFDIELAQGMDIIAKKFQLKASK